MIVRERQPCESAKDYALHLVKENIIALTLRPGEMVSENELAAQLGFSRTPIREALQELSKLQLVEILPQRGSRVCLIDYALVEESRFIRLVIERAIVQIACEQITPPKLHALRENLRAQSFCLAGEQPSKEAFMQLDNAFHRLLFQSAQKENSYDLLSGMMLHFDRVRTLALGISKDSRILTDHQRLVEAIALGDKTRADELITAHLSRYEVDKAAILASYPQYLKDAPR